MMTGLAAPTFAQDQAAQTPALEEIVVTGSRVITNGLQAPTPVTVVGMDQLTATSPKDIGSALQDIPVLEGSTSPRSGGTGTGNSAAVGAQSQMNMRNLGAVRTLVLLDGNRVVSNNATGITDISMFPTQLMQRVDVVTGGASAAYGSDAVSGVVNFILDTNFEGMKGSMQAGISQRGDAKNYKGDVSAGMSFHDGRGHFIISGGYGDDEGLTQADREWSSVGWAVVNNPNSTAATKTAANPLQILAKNVYASNMSVGGLITTAGVLKGISFGPGGVPEPFIYGSSLTGTTMVGGSGQNGSVINRANLYGPVKSLHNFERVSYDVADNLNIYASFMLGTNHDTSASQASFQSGATAFTIFSGNPYIPPSVQAVMTAKNIASFTLGRISPDFVDKTVDDINLNVVSRTRLYQTSVGFKGNFSDAWTYDGSYNFGSSHNYAGVNNNAVNTNTYRAADAVRDPATGNIVCNQTLQNPTSTNPDVRNCVPLNLFGNGSPSDAALRYIMAVAYATRDVDQHDAALNLQGKPFDSWAGPVSLAAGAAYRSEKIDQQVDPRAQGGYVDGTGIRGFPSTLQNQPRFYDRGSGSSLVGDRKVTEGYAEALVPLADNYSWAKSLDLDVAGRYAHYSYSGGNWTYKIGAVYQPVDDLRLRATRSRDVRAPNINELFSTPLFTGGGSGGVFDPFRNNEAPAFFTVTEGNPNLQPEKANTTVLGVIYQPEWFPGFGASFDWYRIKIKDAISALGTQQVVTLCFQGDQSFCQYVDRNPAVGGVLQPITRVHVAQLNAQSLTVDGFDIEANYNAPVSTFVSDWDGDVAFRLLLSYFAHNKTITVGGAPVERAGDINTGNQPKWRGSLVGSYTNGPFGIVFNQKYVGGGLYNILFTDADLDHNHISAKWFTDITARYKLGDAEQYEVFVNVSNLFDTDPAIVSLFRQSGTVATIPGLYDTVGRAFTTGLRFKF